MRNAYHICIVRFLIFLCVSVHFDGVRFFVVCCCCCSFVCPQKKPHTCISPHNIPSIKMLIQNERYNQVIAEIMWILQTIRNIPFSRMNSIEMRSLARQPESQPAKMYTNTHTHEHHMTECKYTMYNSLSQELKIPFDEFFLCLFTRYSRCALF